MDQRMQMGLDWRDLIRRASEKAVARYVIAILMVALIAGFRAAFDAGLGSGAYFILYYPAFVVIAYAFGTGPVFVSIGVALLFAFRLLATFRDQLVHHRHSMWLDVSKHAPGGLDDPQLRDL